MQTSNNFFILGLPRSRTNWMSAFLHGGDVFCGHDFFSTSADTSVFYEAHHLYAGSVDTNPLTAMEYKKNLGAPLVIIRRDPKEVVDSLCKLFGEDKRIYLTKCITSMNDALKEAEVYADLIIDFDDLDESMEEVWELCLPTIKVDLCKVAMFSQINISPKGVNYRDFKREFDLCHF